MKRVLKMYLDCVDGKTVGLSIEDPKTNLAKVNVESFLNNCITKEAIVSGSGNEATSINDYYIYETNRVDLS